MNPAIRRFHEVLLLAARARDAGRVPHAAQLEAAARLADAWRGRVARLAPRQQRGTT